MSNPHTPQPTGYYIAEHPQYTTQQQGQPQPQYVYAQPGQPVYAQQQGQPVYAQQGQYPPQQQYATQQGQPQYVYSQPGQPVYAQQPGQPVYAQGQPPQQQYATQQGQPQYVYAQPGQPIYAQQGQYPSQQQYASQPQVIQHQPVYVTGSGQPVQVQHQTSQPQVIHQLSQPQVIQHTVSQPQVVAVSQGSAPQLVIASGAPNTLVVVKEGPITMQQGKTITIPVTPPPIPIPSYQPFATLPQGPVIPQKTGKIVIEGYLSKKGDKGLIKSWKKRYFSLIDQQLHHAEKKGDPNIQFIQLDQYSRILLSSVHTSGLDDYTHNTSFLIANKKHERIYYLCASSTAERDEWVTALWTLVSALHVNSWAVEVSVKSGKDLKEVDHHPHPYCTIICGQEKKSTKPTKARTVNPDWHDTFTFDASGQSSLATQVWHHNMIRSDVDMGTGTVPFSQLYWGQKQDWNSPLTLGGSIQLGLTPIPTPIPAPQPTVHNREKCYSMFHNWGFNLTDCEIYDKETGHKAFYIQYRPQMGAGHRLYLFDAIGNMLIYIEQHFSGTGIFLPKYTLYFGERGGSIIAKISQEWTLMKEKFNIEFPGVGAPPLILKGDFMNREYELYRTHPTDHSVALISRKLFSWNDRFAIRVAPNEDVALTIAIAVIIEHVLKDKNKDNHYNY